MPKPRLDGTVPETPHAEAATLEAMARDALNCRRCPLYRNATQTVFGEGPRKADIVMVGEQPGDSEDKVGRPFVGPAGRVLDRALEAAGIDRASIYLTNAVKHFKNEPRGKRRLHKQPNTSEIAACRWWIAGELALVRPRLVVALGATATFALSGRHVGIAKSRGQEVILGGLAGLVTMHPSAILRMREPAERDAALDQLVNDLRLALARSRKPKPPARARRQPSPAALAAARSSR